VESGVKGAGVTQNVAADYRRLASPCSLQIAVFVIAVLLLCKSLLSAYAAGGDFFWRKKVTKIR
jgi:hypothetical protein